jgi:hypothetical protein
MRRFVELERHPGGVYRIKKVLHTDMPTTNGGTLVAPPAHFSDDELMKTCVVAGRWMPSQEIDQAQTNGRGRVAVSRDEVFWSGHVMNMGGYAKANREVLLRIRNTIKVELSQQGIGDAPFFVDETVTKILNIMKAQKVSPQAPMVRFYTPCFEDQKRYRVCWTMMETQKIHADFIWRLNSFYDEVWIPTPWYVQVFKDSGLRIPAHVMPLGVNPHIFSPQKGGVIPPCELVTTARAGVREVPKGFLFINIFQPTFRKAADVMVEAFDRAFGDDPEAALLLGITSHGKTEALQAIRPRNRKARIYYLTGNFTEPQLASIYNGCHAYFSASRGEGWNLPMLEAAACGKPIVVPRNTSHLDLVDDSTAYLFDGDGQAVMPGSEKVCGWYAGMPFTIYTTKAINRMAELLKQVKKDYSHALMKAELFRNQIISKWTWDQSSKNVLDRLACISEVN